MQVVIREPRAALWLLLGRHRLVGTFKPLINRSVVAWRPVHRERRQKHNRRAHDKTDSHCLHLALGHKTPFHDPTHRRSDVQFAL